MAARALAAVVGPVALAAVALLGVAAGGSGAKAAGAKPAPVSRSPAVGALFALSSSGKPAGHFCTASVVHSRSGDLVVTAAHCVSGRAPGSFAFVPQYHDGKAPLGVWTVTAVFVDDAWSSSSDPDDDFAFLAVHNPASRTPLEAKTGAERLGIGVRAGLVVEAPGYPAARERPITCRSVSRLFSPTQLEFDCAGYTVGTSGSPLLVRKGSDPGIVVGVIGGYEEGGTTDSVSYAAKFGARTRALYDRADVD